MSDYTITTDFSVKDNLASGDAAKVIKGSYIDTVWLAKAVSKATLPPVPPPDPDVTLSALSLLAVDLVHPEGAAA